MTKLMVMLHGYGSNGDDLMSLAPYFEKLLPDTICFSPNGIEPCEIGIYGYQWFSLADRSEEFIKTQLEAKAEIIRKMIKDKADSMNLTENDIILLGFSQGATVSSYLSLSSEIPYKAVIGFSGWVFLPQKVHNTRTPICLIHGEADDVVHHNTQKIGETELKKLGCTVKTLLIPNLNHSIDMKGLEFASNFINDL